MGLIAYIKRLLCQESFGESMLRHDRDYALRIRAKMDKFDASPSGHMSTVPKTARAFEFYMREPGSFRGYISVQDGMRNMLREHGIEATDCELDDPLLMLPHWRAMEAKLPTGASMHEQWATRFYGA